MNRYQLSRSAPRGPSQCPMIAITLRPSHLRSASKLCARVSMLLSDAHAVALSARHSLSFRRKVLSHVRNAARNVPSSCSAPVSQQESFLFIRFSSLSQRSGIRTLIGNPIVPERISHSTVIPVRRATDVSLATKSHSRAHHTNQLPVEPCEGNIQCQTSLYLCIECTSPR
jgi:hypothetical protein